MIFARGVSHKTCPVGLRERLVARAAGALAALKEQGVAQAVVLSTCNRFEVYAVAEGDSPAELPQRLTVALDALAGGALGPAAYALSGDAAVLHLFRVSAGLDSLVMGEGEILGQVKQAYESARQAGMTERLTNVLFQRALFLGKKVRSDTGIGLGHTSVASVAVDLAERIFGSLREKEVLILGAGKMAELTSKHLASCKIGSLLVSNRTWTRGQELAARFRAQAVRWEDFPSRLGAVDIVIASTGASLPVLTRAMIEAAAAERKGRSLFLIDIAMPRDVEETVNELDHVYLYSLADLEGVVRENVERRKGEFEAASKLVEETAREFSGWQASVVSGEKVSLRHSRPVAAPTTPQDP